ncbi:hypothetical protein KKA15_00485 [Patescibacteria group bacterium]|nr:hypothetical protein [Patescibacteria group bacterium]
MQATKGGAKMAKKKDPLAGWNDPKEVEKLMRILEIGSEPKLKSQIDLTEEIRKYFKKHPGSSCDVGIVFPPCPRCMPPMKTSGPAIAVA